MGGFQAGPGKGQGPGGGQTTPKVPKTFENLSKNALCNLPEDSQNINSFMPGRFRIEQINNNHMVWTGPHGTSKQFI